MSFDIKDSGARQEFAGGMVRDTAEGKLDFLNIRVGPMLRRWAAHMTKGRVKYPDAEPGIPNWTYGEGLAEWLRARESFERHADAWLAGKLDEDHAAAIYANVNFAEYFKARMSPEELAQAERIERLHGFGADL